MALDIKTRYGSRANDPSIDYPTGSIKNKSAPDAADGTPLEKDWANDWLGARDAILQAASIVADGQVEKAGASQVLEAIQQIATDAAESIEKPQASIQGSYKNLRGSATGTSALATYTADQIIVENPSGASLKLSAVSINPSLAASGVNGLDTGTSAASTWYSEWVIYNPTTLTTAGLFSLSATAPTMPSGYTYKALIGWIRSDATANKYPLSFIQNGLRVQYKVAPGSNLTSLRAMASGVAGNVSTPTYIPISISNFVPPSAASIKGLVDFSGTGGAAIIAPNASYGALVSTTNPPFASYAAPSGTNTSSTQFDMMLESSNIYWANAGTSGVIFCSGWSY